MNYRIIYFAILFFTLLYGGFSYSQGFSFVKGKNSETLSFKFINNLIIIPVEVNGAELSFVLDSGVSKPILFNLMDMDSVEIKNVEEFYIKGLGEGDPIHAFKSTGNQFKIKHSIFNNQQDLYVVLDENINFSPRLGFPVHGIIGYDLFRDFVIGIDYSNKRLRFYDPASYSNKKCKKCQQFPIEIIQSKAYINASVAMEGQDTIPVKLLIDSGSSDALWLFESPEDNIRVPEKYFEDFLGRGLSGSIYGHRSRVQKLQMGKFSLPDTKVAFPNASSMKHLKEMKDRNGSIGAEILKRFNVVVDYPNRRVTLRKNKHFSEPFNYNMSGIELQHNGIRFVKELESNFNGVAKDRDDVTGGIKILLEERYKISLHPALEIVEIREGSPAALAGVQKGDIVIAINSKQIHQYSLQEVSEMLNEKEGKKIRLTVDRNGANLTFSFELKKLL